VTGLIMTTYFGVAAWRVSGDSQSDVARRVYLLD
jgi:hypothetical protein